MICHHAKTTISKLICRNGTVHFAEICDGCKVNVRGPAIYIARALVPNPDLCPVHKDNQKQEQAQMKLFE